MKLDDVQVGKIAALTKLEREKVGEILIALDKLDLAVVPVSALERPRREVEITRMENFLREFIQARIKKPSGALTFVPYQEMARQIVKEFKVK